MTYRYRVDCWVNPKSGFDLAEQNSFMAKFKKALRILFPENGLFQRALDNFGKEHEGLILESLIIESDKPYEENKQEIEEEIKKKFPEVKILSHTILKLIKA